MRIFDAFGAGWTEVKAFVPRLLGLLRQLFNEVLGFVFFALAFFFTFSANGLVESARALDQNPDAFMKMVAASVFVGMFGWFGYSNFRRARRISREVSAQD